MVQSQTERQSNSYPGGKHDGRGTDNQPQNVGARGAEGHSYANFLCALRNGEGNYAVKPCGCQGQREKREERKEHCYEPSLPPPACFQPPCQSAVTNDGQIRIELPQPPLHRLNRRFWSPAGAHEQPHIGRQYEAVRKKDSRLDRTFEPVITRVSNHS